MEDYDKEAPFMGGMSAEEIEAATAHDPNLNDEVDSEDEAEIDADRIRETDFVIIAGCMTKGQDASFETYLYGHDEQSLYVHHETYMRFVPFAIEYVGHYRDYSASRHLLAVASSSPVIEIWNNDMVDSVEPIDYLGKDDKRRHKDAVTCLRMNSILQNVLASCSADKSIRLWDLERGEMADKIKWHSDMVSSIRWHPLEGSILASCGQDKHIFLGDVRAPKDRRAVEWEGPLESLAWNRHSGWQLMAVATDGQFLGYDARQMGKPLWVIEASEEDMTDITDTQIPGLVVTCGVAGSAQVWDVRESIPQKKLDRSMGSNALFAVSASPDPVVPTLLALGGTDVIIWDLLDTPSLQSDFNISS
eukprot:Protomagalhaensia_sp_Gyna_25__4890@NODE_516_length_3230_cov_83_832654_g405_i0_p2_GENE_NODE_516_length_3230_cov_83_832654_g405_i0NODE_516_length_3230_cov_83_832654_g405_i0_p2_ORF_typecomplete_len362_score66_18ANAPC4_WD40/PF12894_7/1_9e12ANAPC4_WD40/PF12894_7/0_21ANAPC4_WD40/PF12894_7/22WD40/PF00400_32/9_9e02WD40/PF00400_32/7_2e06WD40/PF00400_32/0_0045WD40/PF00400_32/66WD40/PF00400_32/3_4e03Nup160/PF11715_8/5_8e05WD40_like/PF17005_5/0_0021WD40_like/PF17005_5/3_9e02PALB2_WD40/PF16756_5/0_0052PALB2_